MINRHEELLLIEAVLSIANSLEKIANPRRIVRLVDAVEDADQIREDIDALRRHVADIDSRTVGMMMIGEGKP